MSDEVTRTESGQFQKGVSGNPAGRPKGRKNELTEIKQELEYAVRKSLSADKVVRIVNKMVELAENGNVRAAKLILDKTVSNTRESDDVEAGKGGIVIRIENATLLAQKQREQQPIQGEFTEVSE